MTTSTQVSELKINKLTKAQYSTITPSDTELYFVTDEDTTLPSQSGQSGKFLTTNGSQASWAPVDALPSQSGNEGKFLTTDGTDASWAPVDALPDQTDNAGKFLTTDGTDASWTAISQNTKFAINKGNPELLLAPGSGTVDVMVSDPTICGGSIDQHPGYYYYNETIDFPSPKTLLSVSAICWSWPNYNGNSLAQIFAVLNDDSEVELGYAYTAQTGYRTDVNVNYEFSTPTIVKSLKMVVRLQASGSGGVYNVSYVERVSVSTADNLYFNTTVENPITYTNVLGETRTEVGLLPINVSGTPYFVENFTKVGNPTISNGVISGFSDSNYLIQPQVFNPQSNSWEIVRKITTGNDVTTDQYILTNNQTNGYGMGLHILNSKFNLYLSSNGSSWDIASDVNGSYTVLANTDYYVKLLFTGTQYKVQYSTDGIAFNDDIVITNSNVISVQSLPMVIGRYLWSGYSFVGPWLGSIDLKECYDKIGNEIVWSCMRSTSDGTYKVVLPQTGNQPYLFNGEILNQEVEPTAKNWKQPVLTANGTMGGDSFAVKSSSYCSSPDRNPYKSFDGNPTTKWGVNNSSSGWLTFYNPEPIKVSSIVYTPSTDFPNEDGGNLEISGSNNNSDWTSLWTGNYIANSAKTFDVNSSNYYNYYRISISNGATVWVGLGNLVINALVELNNGDIWLNPQEPYSVKQFDGADWQDFNDVILQDSKVTVSGGVITALEQPTYNYNAIELNQSSKTNREYITSLGIPDLTATPLPVYDNTNFTTSYDGFLQGIVACGHNAGNSFIDFFDSNGTLIKTFMYGYSGVDINQYAITLPVSKGITIKIRPSLYSQVWLNGAHVTGQLSFYPLKGAN